MINFEVYAEELSDYIDNAIQALEDADYGDFLEDIWSDAEADADTLASAGWGTDEDYGMEDAFLDSYWEGLSEPAF